MDFIAPKSYYLQDESCYNNSNNESTRVSTEAF